MNSEQERDESKTTNSSLEPRKEEPSDKSNPNDVGVREAEVEQEEMRDGVDAEGAGDEETAELEQNSISIADLLGAVESKSAALSNPSRDDKDKLESGILRLRLVKSDLNDGDQGPSDIPPISVPSSGFALKTSLVVSAAVGIVIVATAVVVYSLVRKDDNRQSVEFQKLQAQLAEMKETRGELALARAKEKDALVKAAAVEAEAKRAAQSRIAAEERAESETAASEDVSSQVANAVDAKPAVKAEAGAGKPKSASKRSTSSEDSRSTVAPKSADDGSGDKSVESASEKKGSDELDKLLDSADSRKRQTAAKSSETKDNGVTKRPGKEEVRAVMAPVAAKAGTCSKYSTGTVQVKLTVGNDGRVRKSETLGSFANTTAGKCVEMIARTARFKEFQDPSFSFTYPVILR